LPYLTASKSIPSPQLIATRIRLLYPLLCRTVLAVERLLAHEVGMLASGLTYFLAALIPR
jgi:hypothetical protein